MRKAIFLGAAACSALIAAGPASAQAPAPGTAPTTPTIGAEESAGDDVIVTARRRAESLDQVPTQVSAFTAADLQTYSVESGLDLTQFTPGLTVTNNGTGINNEFIIRGEGATRQNNSETGSGLYRDGMFIAGGNAGGRDFAPLDFFDAERIEVLRGPQGSYYGRNALGGAVNILSTKPLDVFSAFAEARGGSQESYGGEVILNAPVSSAVAVRVGAFGDRQDGGFYRSSITGAILDRERRWGVRGQVAFKLGDALRINLLGEHSYESTPQTEVVGFVLPVNDPPYNAPGPTGFSIDRFNKPIDTETRFTRRIETFRADVSYDLGFATLQSITGHRRRRATSAQDADFNAQTAIQRLLNATINAREDFKRFYQDLRLTSAQGGKLTWLIGAEYTKVDSELPSLTNALVPTVAPAGCTAAIGCSLAVIQGTARAVYRNAVSGVDDTSWAAYGALTFNASDRLSITVDGRYTVDDKSFSSLDLRRLDNPATPANEQLTTTIATERTFRKFTPGVSISYRLSAAATVYARVATAYRAGGFNNDPGEPNDGVSAIAVPLNYDAEYVTGYEAGLKGRAAGIGRYSISAYYSEKSNTLLNYGIFVGCPAAPPRAGCLANTVRIAPTLLTGGDSHQYGVEAELSGRVVEGPLGRVTYRTSATWADGAYDGGISYTNQTTNPAATLVANDVTGRRLGRLREWTLTGTLGYTVPIAPRAALFANLQVRAELGGFEDPRETNVYDDVTIVNATVGADYRNWSLSFLVRNLFENRYYVISPLGQFFTTQINEPRTFQVRLSAKFGS